MKRFNMDRALFFPVTLALIWLVTAAVAFADLKISHLKVSLWPEYDTPQVLVIIDGTVAPSVSLPTPIKVQVQQGANPHVASVTPTGGHIHDPFTTEIEDDVTFVIFSLKERNFHAEYYYSAFPAGQPNKAFTYMYLTPYEVENFTLTVKQPLGASNFVTSPTPYSSSVDAKGLMDFFVSAGNVPAGQTRQVTLSYYKPDDIPSLTKLARAEKGGSFYNYVLIGVVVVLLGLLIRAGYKRGFRKPAVIRAGARRQSGSDSGRRRQPLSGTRGARKARAERKDRIPKFCSNCGALLSTDVKFCGECGHAVIQG